MTVTAHKMAVTSVAVGTEDTTFGEDRLDVIGAGRANNKLRDEIQPRVPPSLTSKSLKG